HVGKVRAHAEEGGEHLAPGVDDGMLPIPLGGRSGVIAGDAAQQAVVRVDQRRIGGLGAQRTVERRLRNRVEVGGLAGDAGQVVMEAEFTAGYTAGEDIVVIDHRVHDGGLALNVHRGEAIEV